MDSKYVQNIYDHYLLSSQGKGPEAYYSSGRGQRGAGIGSFLKGIFRQVLPFLKGGVKSLGEEVLKGGVGVLKDSLKGKSLKESLGLRMREAGGNLTEKAARKVESMVGGGRLKGRRRRRKHQSTSGRVTKRTISRKKKSPKKKTTRKKSKKTSRRKAVRKRRSKGSDIFD